jgi:uncharacterized protein (DUF58 family)
VGRRALTFPLVPRWRVSGAPFGSMRSVRRGTGSEVSSTRPYRPGDDIRSIDRFASARASAASGRDEYVVRERYADEAARVAIVADGSPSMALFPPELPWLRKPEAVAEAAALIEASARRARCPVRRLEADRVTRALDELGRQRSSTTGSFVFVLSDFLEPPPAAAWRRVLARGWDLVPVVIQDPRWEQSFPAVAGAVLPLVEPAGGKRRHARLRRADAELRRLANERRLAALQAGFKRLGADPVILSSHEPGAIVEAFLVWATRRSRIRRWAA